MPLPDRLLDCHAAADRLDRMPMRRPAVVF
jgi:hypothetical protein